MLLLQHETQTTNWSGEDTRSAQVAERMKNRMMQIFIDHGGQRDCRVKEDKVGEYSQQEARGREKRERRHVEEQLRWSQTNTQH